MNYFASLAAFAVARIKDKAQRAAVKLDLAEPPSKAEARATEKKLRATAAAIRKTTFPNALGNYKGKRTPKPFPGPLSPRERFARLQTMHLEFRKTYRNLKLA